MKKILKLLGFGEAEPFVWVYANPEHPHAGIATISEEKPEQRPAFKVTSIHITQARPEFCGKVLDWDQVHGMKRGEKEVTAETFKKWFK